MKNGKIDKIAKENEESQKQKESILLSFNN